MTMPTIEPVRYRAVLTAPGEQPDRALATEELQTPAQARGWVRAWLAHPAQQHAATRAGITQFRVRIIDTVPIAHMSPVIYDFTGTTTEVAAALADTASTVIVDDVRSGRRPLDAAAIVPPLVRLYEHVTAEVVRSPEDGQLAAKRLLLRSDLAMTIDGLEPAQRHATLNRVAVLDLVPLASPTGRFTAAFDVLEADSGVLNRPMHRTRFVAVAEQRFDSRAHAREYLRLLGETYPGDRLVRARLTEARPDGGTNSIAMQGEADKVIQDLLNPRGFAFDGTLITGLEGVDKTRVAELVRRYDLAANDSPNYQFIQETADGVAMRRHYVPSPYSMVGMELAHMLTDPRMAAELKANREVLARIDLGLRTHHNVAVDVPAVASSGFMGAEIQVALTQHRDLQQLRRDELRRTPAQVSAADIEQIGTQITEIRDRIHALLSHPSLTVTERIMVLEDIARADRSPESSYAEVFTLPSAEALAKRAELLVAQPTATDPATRGRDIDDLLRLYQLARVVGVDSSPGEQFDLHKTQFALHRHLELRIATHPGLLPGERTVLRSQMISVGHDSYHELLSQRAEHIADPVPAERLLPVAVDAIDNYRVSFDDPNQPGRRVVVGTEKGRWVARNYVPYPGAPQWKLADGAAAFPDHRAMIAALAEGVLYPGKHGTQRMGPVRVPAKIVDRLSEVHKLQSDLAGGQSPTSSPRPSNPPVRRTAAQRVQALRQQPRKGPRHRRLG
ncbi:hypothetical protein [Nocardia noduli]|uniref:hypothetical protein n=1 Tax=Nocardia noduli TaxID=2815722 RepID=UPI001C2447C2|nr:hypothetical protein [Nocardia noduli]